MQAEDRIKIIHGDCVEVMKTIESCSHDSMVTDPPSGIAFMNQKWDKNKGGRDPWIAWLTEVMTEAIRILKPGAYALVWALPRTAHWTCTALENVGFAVRDRIEHYFTSVLGAAFLASLSDEQRDLLDAAFADGPNVAHLFGQGFPKNHNVSKAIDKKKGATRKVVGSWKATGTSRPRKGGKGHSAAQTTGAIENYDTDAANIAITLPQSTEAILYHDYGTALRPAYEVWFLVQKPPSTTAANGKIKKATIADNVLEHGAGAINIGACRIDRATTINRFVEGAKPFGGAAGAEYETHDQEGGWPANAVFTHSPRCVEGGACHDSCSVAALDRQSGVRVSGARKSGARSGMGFGGAEGDGGPAIQKSSGGASNFFNCFYPDPLPFFYTSKTSSSEKNIGVESAAETTSDGREKAIDNAYQRGKTKRANMHPTVKPQSLMRWGCRLVTPIGGKILEPFCGSGSTVVAADTEEFSCTAIEAEAKYVDIANQRLKHNQKQGKLFGAVGGSRNNPPPREPKPAGPQAQTSILDRIGG